jgi:hypothetical protein
VSRVLNGRAECRHRGYFKIEDIEACGKAGITPYVPKPQRGSSVSNGFPRKDEFRYDAEHTVFHHRYHIVWIYKVLEGASTAHA